MSSKWPTKMARSFTLSLIFKNTCPLNVHTSFIILFFFNLYKRLKILRVAGLRSSDIKYLLNVLFEDVNNLYDR